MSRWFVVLLWLLPQFGLAIPLNVLDSATEGKFYSESLEMWGVGRGTYEKLSGPPWVRLNSRGILMGTPQRGDETPLAAVEVKIHHNHSSIVRRVGLRVYSPTGAEQAHRAWRTCQIELDGYRRELKVNVAKLFGCIQFSTAHLVPGIAIRKHDEMLSKFLGLKLVKGFTHHINEHAIYGNQLAQAIRVVLERPVDYPRSAKSVSDALKQLPAEFWGVRLKEALIFHLNNSYDIQTLRSLLKLLKSDLDYAESHRAQSYSDYDVWMKWNFIESRSLENALAAIPHDFLQGGRIDRDDMRQAEQLAIDSFQLLARLRDLKSKILE